MFWSMAPLVVACVVLAGLLGMCSFQPMGPSAGAPPSYDASVAMHADAETLGFPVRLPQLPEGWAANSGGRNGIEEGRTDAASGLKVRAAVSRLGYLAPSGMYVALIQSDADEEALVSSLDPNLLPQDAVNVDGTRWVVYRGGEGVAPVWTTRLKSSGGQAQIAITGDGDESEFRTLAASVQSQRPLPAQRG